MWGYSIVALICIPLMISNGFPRWLSGKESTCQCRRLRRDAGSILGSGRSPGGGNGNSLQCSWLENPMDGEGQWSIVHRVAKSDTTEWLSMHTMANDTENLPKYLLVISISSWLRRLFISFAHFLIVSFIITYYWV